MTSSGSSTLESPSQHKRARSKASPGLSSDFGVKETSDNDFDEFEEGAEAGEDDDFGDFGDGVETESVPDEHAIESQLSPDESPLSFVSRACSNSCQIIRICIYSVIVSYAHCR